MASDDNEPATASTRTRQGFLSNSVTSMSALHSLGTALSAHGRRESSRGDEGCVTGRALGRQSQDALLLLLVKIKHVHLQRGADLPEQRGQRLQEHRPELQRCELDPPVVERTAGARAA